MLLSCTNSLHAVWRSISSCPSISTTGRRAGDFGEDFKKVAKVRNLVTKKLPEPVLKNKFGALSVFAYPVLAHRSVHKRLLISQCTCAAHSSGESMKTHMAGELLVETGTKVEKVFPGRAFDFLHGFHLSADRN